ncbi:hypothetical protein [Caballeronia fortuita]|uniref:hypothetical protein n=1 Tax=Caballeronia fortuita TaxID=1777138 RepID=UPI000A95F440|nr:hypothetical protein [Caballeronia fortuita]
MNLRAGLAAFSDVHRVIAVNLDQFDPLDPRDDLIKLLVETAISFPTTAGSASKKSGQRASAMRAVMGDASTETHRLIPPRRHRCGGTKSITRLEYRRRSSCMRGLDLDDRGKASQATHRAGEPRDHRRAMRTLAGPGRRL